MITKKSFKFLKHKVKGNSLSEILIVLCIIGILIYLVLPNQASVVVKAKSLEAQNMLNMVYSLEKSYFFRYSKFSDSFDEIGFEQEATIDIGGQAVYKIEIIESTLNSFKARATSLQDFDGDGAFNTWEIDQNRILKEIIKD